MVRLQWVRGVGREFILSAEGVEEYLFTEERVTALPVVLEEAKDLEATDG
jgi:hypothetical protein